MLQAEGIAGAEAWGWDRSGRLDQAHVWQEDGEPGLLGQLQGPEALGSSSGHFYHVQRTGTQ